MLPPPPASRNGWLWLIAGSLLAVLLPQCIRPWVQPAGLDLENRAPAKFPPVPTSWDSVRHWARDLDAYLVDHFPARPVLIRTVNAMRYNAGYSGTRKVAVGRQGWLFYDDGTHSAIAMGEERLRDAELDDWFAGLEQRVEAMRPRGIGFYVLFAPTKETVYPAFRPVWMKQGVPRNEIDDILTAGRKRGLDQLVYPRDALMRASATQPLWDEFDTHWTAAGAHIAYSELLKRIQRDYPEMVPLPIDHFRQRHPRDAATLTDLANMLGISALVSRPRLTFQDSAADNGPTQFKDQSGNPVVLPGRPPVLKTGRTLLLLRDSFGLELLPLLKPHFDKVVVAHLDKGFWRPDLIEKHAPDVVVLEAIETGARHVMQPLPARPSPVFPARTGDTGSRPGGACNFDSLNASPVVAGADGIGRKSQLEVQGWSAISADEAIVPDANVLGIRRRGEPERYVRARHMRRDDVARYFSRAGLRSSGFQALIDTTGLAGGYELTVQLVWRGSVYRCPLVQQIRLGS